MSDQNDDTIVLDLGSGSTGYSNDYIISSGAGTDTITLGGAGSYYTYDPMAYTTISNGGYTIGATGASGTSSTWTTTITPSTYNYYDSNVNITGSGITMKDGTDITVGGKSLTSAIAKIEERLNILTPNPALEDRWEQLKALRQQYIDLEKDLLEKEKLMKILKET